MSDSDNADSRQFKRINYFKGFLMTEADMNDAESYHIKKRKLQNRIMHSPGVVLGHGGELRVVARARGDLSVEVQSGFAIDGGGNELVLWDPTIRCINADEFRLPQTVYIVLRFREELTDFVAYKENLDFKGHKRVEESAVVEISQTEPDITREIELARIYLEKGVTRIRDARDPSDPRANEIDLRFRPRAGVAGSFLSPPMRLRLETVLWHLHNTFLEYTRRNVISGLQVLNNTATAIMLNSTNAVDLRNAFDIFYLIVEAQGETCLDVDVNHPTIAAKEEFSDYKRHVEILRGLLAERKYNLEGFTNLLAYQAKASEVAEAAVSGEAAKINVPKDEPKKTKQANITDWEGVKTMPEPQANLDLEGTQWVLVDQIDILDKQSEKKHEFKISDYKDRYRTRQKLKYPDGTVVESTGWAHVGGQTTFKILNLTPNRPVVILRRMDYVYGDYEIEYLVDGKAAGFASCTGTDRVHRWRNWPVMIDAEHITDSSVTITQKAVTADRDINMFQLWFYQPR